MTLDAALRELVRQEVERALGELRPADHRRLITVRDWCRARSLGASTAREAIREGRLASTRIGRAVRVWSDAEIVPRAGKMSAADRARRILGGGR